MKSASEPASDTMLAHGAFSRKRSPPVAMVTHANSTTAAPTMPTSVPLNETSDAAALPRIQGPSAPRRSKTPQAMSTPAPTERPVTEDRLRFRSYGATSPRRGGRPSDLRRRDALLVRAAARTRHRSQRETGDQVADQRQTNENEAFLGVWRYSRRGRPRRLAQQQRERARSRGCLTRSSSSSFEISRFAVTDGASSVSDRLLPASVHAVRQNHQARALQPTSTSPLSSRRPGQRFPPGLAPV